MTGQSIVLRSRKRSFTWCDVQAYAGVGWFCSGFGGKSHRCDCTYNTSNCFWSDIDWKHISECYQSLWFYKIKFTERVRKDYMKIKYSKFYLFWKIYIIHINVLYIGKTIWKFWPKDLMVKYIEMLIINAKMNTCVPKTVKSTWALRRRKG